MAERRASGRSVTSKVVALLDAFGPGSPELTLNELSARTGLPLSTAHRLVTELVEWGGLERCEGAGYRVGLRMWEIGSLAPRGESLRDVALPVMQDLYEGTKENVHLAVRQDTEALYLDKIHGPDALPVKSRRGGRLPLHATGVGKVLLAYAPDNLRARVLAGELPRFTRHTIVEPGRVARVLDEVRDTGIAFAYEELTIGSLSVAAPIRDASGEVVAALDVVLHTSGGRPDRLALAVRTAAISISRALRDRQVGQRG
jgi:DNA-binding IclR family transcriptional regulator